MNCIPEHPRFISGNLRVMRPRTLLEVVVKPASRSPGISIADGAVEVRVAARAHGGLANEAARKALAKALGLPPTSLLLVRGAAARHKAFEVAGIGLDEALIRLAATARGR